MLNPASLDALARIAARANDVLSAYTPGAMPTHTDVMAAPQTPDFAASPLSVVAPDGGYFLVQNRDGSRAFSRAGDLQIRDGVLSAPDGAPVLGFAGPSRTPGGVPQTLKLPDADRLLGRTADARIESDGSFVYTRPAIDPRTGERTSERVVIGTLALARFPAGTQAARIDATHVSAPAGVSPHIGTPSDGTFAGLATYSRDRSRIDIDAGLQKLQEAYLAFGALRAAMNARGSVEKSAMDLVK